MSARDLKLAETIWHICQVFDRDEATARVRDIVESSERVANARGRVEGAEMMRGVKGAA